MPPRTLRFVAALLAGVCDAQDFPLRPVRIVVPCPSGGPTDTLARGMAQPPGAALAQGVLGDNCTGAGGIIGSDLVEGASADGHTLLWATAGTHAIHPGLYAKPPYDPVKNSAAVALPARAVAELRVLARVQPGNLSLASASTWHALSAPAGTPRSVVVKLNGEVVRIVRLPGMQTRMSVQGAPVGGTLEQLE